MKNFKNVATVVGLGIALAAIVLILHGFYNLDVIEKIFSIVGSSSLLVAILTYLYTKDQDNDLATIDQITFFRTEIISKWGEVRDRIKIKNPIYWFSNINLYKYKLEDIKSESSKSSKNLANQLSIFLDISALGSGGEVIDNNILDHQIYLLNMFEEFALKVKHLHTINHPALSSIRTAYVDLVEKNAGTLIFIRDIQGGNGAYSNLLSLYEAWVDKVEKVNLLGNLEKYGFITKEKKSEILKRQRKNVAGK